MVKSGGGLVRPGGPKDSGPECRDEAGLMRRVLVKPWDGLHATANQPRWKAQPILPRSSGPDPAERARTTDFRGLARSEPFLKLILLDASQRGKELLNVIRPRPMILPHWSLFPQVLFRVLRRIPFLIAALLAVSVGPYFVGLSAAEPPPPDPVSLALEQLRAANEARSELARETAEWQVERDRLRAVIAATSAERDRLRADAESNEKLSAEAQTKLSALGAGSDLQALEEQLARGAAVHWQRLQDLAAQVPPGIFPRNTTNAPAGTGDFDSLAKALDAAERAATGVSVEFVVGQLNGQSTPIKLLRIAGAAGWWISLDETQAGPVELRKGVLELIPANRPDERQAIQKALHIAEGRSPASLVMVPLRPLVAGGGQ